LKKIKLFISCYLIGQLFFATTAYAGKKKFFLSALAGSSLLTQGCTACTKTGGTLFAIPGGLVLTGTMAAGTYLNMFLYSGKNGFQYDYYTYSEGGKKRYTNIIVANSSDEDETNYWKICGFLGGESQENFDRLVETEDALLTAIKEDHTVATTDYTELALCEGETLKGSYQIGHDSKLDLEIDGRALYWNELNEKFLASGDTTSNTTVKAAAQFITDRVNYYIDLENFGGLYSLYQAKIGVGLVSSFGIVCTITGVVVAQVYGQNKEKPSIVTEKSTEEKIQV